MTRGVILVCLGNPYYAKMAAALAATIKAADIQADITLAYAGDVISTLTSTEKGLFDQLTVISSDKYEGNRYLRAKLFLPELSPYEETLYLDVDMAWMGGTIDDLLRGCTPYEFVMKNYGHKPLNKCDDNKKDWALCSDISLAYNLQEQKYFHLSSEVIYFKKTEKVLAMFEAAQKVFDSPKIPFRKFAGNVADEMAFSIAMMQTELYPAIDKWEPVWWIQSNKSKPVIHLLRESFYAISMGGVRATSQQELMYNNVVSAAYTKLGIPNPYKWVNKHRFLKERKEI